MNGFGGHVLIKNEEVLLSIGMFCLAAAIILKRFGDGVPGSAFVEGMLIGMSVVLNVTYLVRRRSRRSDR
jgi:hypothetical protein